MEVKLIGHTKLSDSFLETLNEQLQEDFYNGKITDGQAIALSAIRTCYSHNEPSEIINLEGDKYFNKLASDGKGGTDADRLIRHIMNSGHLSTTEHVNFTFAIEGVSRSLLAQLTRHRHFSYSVQSQRYVKFGSEDKSQGFNYVVPKTITVDKTADMFDFVYGTPMTNRPSTEIYKEAMEMIQLAYNKLREAGVPAEDARYILPNAATCNLVLTGNLRSVLEFYSKRNQSTHASAEIKELAELMKERVIEVEPWTESFFKN
jgi:thymidylate synthase (FAD)